MEIRYTHHARQRMSQRNISEDEVAGTIESPDEILIGDEGEEIAIHLYGGVEIRVVYFVEDDGNLVVITVIKSRV